MNRAVWIQFSRTFCSRRFQRSAAENAQAAIHKAAITAVRGRFRAAWAEAKVRRAISPAFAGTRYFAFQGIWVRLRKIERQMIPNSHWTEALRTGGRCFRPTRRKTASAAPATRAGS